MTVAQIDEVSPPSQSSRTLLGTFLGSIVRRLGNWMPIGGAVDLMGQLGLDAPRVRTSVFRLKKRGWLISETRGGVRGYVMTEAALKAIGAGDEVIWHARQSANLEDGWCIVNFSVPESDRNKRHLLRANLSYLGFGNVSRATWIAPARMRPAAERAIDELDLMSYCAIFAGDYVSGQDLSSLVQNSWDLAGIDESYRRFIEYFSWQASLFESTDVIDPSEAFVAYVGLIDHWRELPFRDPGLPEELLPDGWNAMEASALFGRLVVLLEGRALGHAARFWPASQ